VFIHSESMPKELTAFRVDVDVMAGLRAVKERDHIPLSVQVHLALTAWLESRGVTKKKTARPRVASKQNRKRA
jgi:hypothetical protein